MNFISQYVEHEKNRILVKTTSLQTDSSLAEKPGVRENI